MSSRLLAIGAAVLCAQVMACGARTDLDWSPEVGIDGDSDAGIVDGMRLVPGADAYIGNWDFSSEHGSSFSGVSPCRTLSDEVLHRFVVPAFLLDVFPVTNADYARCVDAGLCDVPEGDIADPDQRPWNDEGRRNVPVITSQRQAISYCGWQGKRLPTWAELARGAQGDSIEPGVAMLTKAAIDCYVKGVGDAALCAMLDQMDGRLRPRPKLYDVGTVQLDRGPAGHRDLFGVAQRTATFSSPSLFCPLTDGGPDFVTLEPGHMQHVVLELGASVMRAIRPPGTRPEARTWPTVAQPALLSDAETAYPFAFRCARSGGS